jgi:GAF domain-containing protein
VYEILFECKRYGQHWTPGRMEVHGSFVDQVMNALINSPLFQNVRMGKAVPDTVM